MPTAKITAGGSIRTLDKDELAQVLDAAAVSWRKELSRGDKYRRFSRQGTVAADGTLVIGGSDSSVEGFGPAESVMWSVSRVAVTNALGTPVLRLFVNSSDASALVRGDWTVTAGESFHEFGSNCLVLQAGDVLLMTGTGLTAATVVTVTGQARELPFNQAWRLGGGA